MPDMMGNMGGSGMEKTALSQIDHKDDLKTGHDESDSHDDMKQESITVPMSILGDNPKQFHPGDEVILRVKSMQGDMVELEYAPEPDHEDSMDMKHMGKDEMDKMPLDKMEKHLPKAKREGYE